MDCVRADARCSGSNIVHTRAVASRDTWLLRYKKSYIYSDTTDHSVPIQGMFDHYLVDPLKGAKLGRSMDRPLAFFMEGWARSYRKHPREKWYGVCGDDFYMHGENVLRMLDDVDESHGHEPLLVVDMPFVRRLTRRDGTPAELSWKKWPGGETVRKQGTFTWSSGAVMYFMNNAAMALYSNNIDYFLKTTVPEADLCQGCPDVYTGLIAELLQIKMVSFPRKWTGASKRGAIDHTQIEPPPLITHKEFWGAHFVSPRKMLAMHQRAIHERLDRLVNTGDAEQVVKYFRDFADKHFMVLRKRQQEVTVLAKKVSSLLHGDRPPFLHGVRDYDIPDPNTFEANPQNEFGPSLPPVAPLYFRA